MTPSARQPDPMAQLLVLRRLDVGPLRLEPRRVIMPYTVEANGKVETFDSDDPSTHNLGAMMGAQVALNYGLFCREIVFHDCFDMADQRFLSEMAKNTAREIFVKKFLQPNIFLKPAAAHLPPVRRDSYLQAELYFPNGTTALPPLASPWGTDRTRIAVLSSGGKESLLSFSLLRQMGYDVHAIFVNESGRHWFTALNAYRHFRQHIPRTFRLWTNSDRLFAWMLRHLSFIRADFERLRADDYPIRLWTVAVFLFGALPLLRKYGVPRLVVGDEFDTTARRTYAGITHYDGLYDQSRYFDLAVTRYFQRKSWGVKQFSILRPLSELLVEKVLVERYPDMQRLQTSCHATHKENDRIHPCGHCEKCTRVVAMLIALGADPTACGYTTSQIEQCLDNLKLRGAMQEEDALQHLAFLLDQRGLLPAGGVAGVKARERPEIFKLRFDAERSPMDDIPHDLRQSLYRILLEHAQGAVRRVGHRWVDFDPLTSPDIQRPYRFEAIQPSWRDKAMPTDTTKRTYILGELTWPEARQRFAEVDLALLPVGSIEQHGPHLPLDTDAFDADCLCREVAARCSNPKPLVLPLIPYGVSYHHDDFVGTISIGPETLSQLVYEVGMATVRHGVTKLIIVNGHGGNKPALQFAAQLINRDAHIFTCVDSGETSDTDVENLSETPNDVHAGEIETSTSLANRPDLVQMDKAARSVPSFSSHYLDFSSKRSVDWYARTEKISETGVMGDPTKASHEKGEKMWQLMIDHLLAFVEDIKRMSLDEIHQRSPY